MKARILTVLACLCICVSVGAQRNADRLIDVIKKDDASVTVKVPGWLIERAFKFAVRVDQDDDGGGVYNVDINVNSSDDPLHQDQDIEAWKRISESIKQVRVSFIDQARDEETSERANALINRLQEEDNFATYAKVRSDGDQVEVMVREDKGVVKNLLLYVHGDGTMGVIHVKGNIKVSDFERAQFSWQKSKDDEDDN